MASSQQTQQGVIQVAFEDGATAVYAAASGSILNFSFDTDSVLFSQQGEDLVITNANGDSVVIEDYIALAEAGNAPQVMLDDGITVAGDVFLFSVGQEETAADAAMSGGGVNPFFDNPGSLYDGVEGLQNDQDSLPQDDQGEDFSSAFSTEDVGFGEDVNGVDDVGAPLEYPVIEEHTEPFPTDFVTRRPLSEDAAIVELNQDSSDPRSFVMFGTEHDNYMNGGASIDIMFGREGNDTMHGNGGHDYMDGGSGDDMIYGGGGYDTITLGTGEDVVVFNDATFGDGESIVVINDFNIGEDAIHLEGDATLGLLRTYDDQGYVEAVLNNGAGDNVIVRMEGTTQADFDAYINANPVDVATGDDQLLQYMAGNESAWV